MTAPEAYRMFLAALESMGLTVQPQGKVLKIIESARARESAIPIYSEGNNPPSQDQYVTRLLRLDNVPVDELKTVLDRLKGKDGDITVYPPTNTLIITDLATNIRKIEQVVQQLDVAMGGERIWVIKLKTLSATDMANTLQQIFGVAAKGAAPAAGAKSPRTHLAAPTEAGKAAPAEAGTSSELSISQIIPDDRNNLLIIVSTEKAYQRVLAVVRRLDLANQAIRGDNSTDIVHVIPLENANVEDVAGTLAGLGAGVDPDADRDADDRTEERAVRRRRAHRRRQADELDRRRRDGTRLHHAARSHPQARRHPPPGLRRVRDLGSLGRQVAQHRIRVARRRAARLG
jgi:general secretion pathway protein D